MPPTVERVVVTHAEGRFVAKALQDVRQDLGQFEVEGLTYDVMILRLTPSKASDMPLRVDKEGYTLWLQTAPEPPNVNPEPPSTSKE